MRCIDRLVWRAFWPRFIAIFLAALFIYVSVELVDLINRSGIDALWSYGWRLPLAVVLISPLVLMVSGCWACVGLHRTKQLLALNACGISSRRVLLVLVLFGAFWSALSWYGGAEIAPRCLGEVERESSSQQPRWSLGEDGALIRIAAADMEGSDPAAVIVVERSDGEPQRWLEAAGRHNEAGHWMLEEVVVTDNQGPSRLVGTMPSPASISRDVAPPDPRILPTPRLRESEETARTGGRDPAPYAAEAGLRIALALYCAPCLILGALLGLRFGHRANGAALAVALASVVAWAVLSPFWVLASVGLLSGWAVALIPAGLLTVVSGGVFWRL